MAITEDDIENARETLGDYSPRDALRAALRTDAEVSPGIIGSIVLLLTVELMDQRGYSEAEARAAVVEDPRVQQLCIKAGCGFDITDPLGNPRPARKAFTAEDHDMDAIQAGDELDRRALRLGGDYSTAVKTVLAADPQLAVAYNALPARHPAEDAGDALDRRAVALQAERGITYEAGLDAAMDEDPHAAAVYRGQEPPATATTTTDFAAKLAEIQAGLDRLQARKRIAPSDMRPGAAYTLRLGPLAAGGGCFKGHV